MESQLPIQRALQRDEAAIAHWRATIWPALWDRARRESRACVFVDEAGFYLLPGVVRTYYAPVGQTPVLREWTSRDHLSVMGGLTTEGKVYVLVRDTALNGLQTIAFLEHLRRHTGERLLVIWDGSPIHRRAEVTDFLAGAAGEGISVEALPGYAPDLNPWDTGAWQHLKNGVAQRELYGSGGVAFGTRPRDRPLAPETRVDSRVLPSSGFALMKL